MLQPVRAVVLTLAVLGILFSGFRLSETTRGLRIESSYFGAIPVTVFQQANATGPLVVLVHGFAGSRPLMQAFAITFARNGYVAATFDLSGHGRNRKPLTGDLTQIDGATQVLVNDVTRVVDALQSHQNRRDALAVLGHSMSSDIAVRFAQSRDDVQATIGVSLFSPAITAESPRNLLIINGELERRFKAPSRTLLAQVASGVKIEPGVTYGNESDGTLRRLVEAKWVEHVGVLFSRQSMSESLAWLNRVFDRESDSEAYVDQRGANIALLVLSIVLLWWSLVPLLPRLARHAEPHAKPLAEPSQEAKLSGARLGMTLLAPMLATPLILNLVPTNFLPVLVGDYLAVHFAVYGSLTALMTLLLRSPGQRQTTLWPSHRPLGLAVVILLLLSLPLCVAIHWQIASFLPILERLPLMLAILVGTLCWFLSDEGFTREATAWRWAYPASKVCFLISLGIAVALDFEGLFFLLLIVPVMVPLLIVFGLLSRWSYAASGRAIPAAISNAVVFAWAIAVTFPMVQ